MPFDPVDFARNQIKYFVEKEEPDPEEYSRVNYIMRGDGVWEIRKNKVATFVAHKFKGKVSGFAEEHSLEEGFELNLPKIPKVLLDQILSFFRKLTDDHDFEAYIQIFWSPENEEYFLFCPEQKVSKGRVEYEPSNLIADNVLVCEIHSHNSMSAFFSNVDDADEKQRGDRFFGVVGHLNTVMPKIKLSFIIGGGERVYVELEDLFEYEPFPSEWLKKITYVDRKKNPEFFQKPNKKYPYSQGSGFAYNQANRFHDQTENDDEEEDLEDTDQVFLENKMFAEQYMNQQDMFENDDSSEDIYDNMNVVMIDDLEQFGDWESDTENMRGKLNDMLASQGIIGSEEE